MEPSERSLQIKSMYFKEALSFLTSSVNSNTSNSLMFTGREKEKLKREILDNETKASNVFEEKLKREILA